MDVALRMVALAHLPRQWQPSLTCHSLAPESRLPSVCSSPRLHHALNKHVCTYQMASGVAAACSFLFENHSPKQLHTGHCTSLGPRQYTCQCGPIPYRFYLILSYSRTVHPKNFTLDTAHPGVLINAPAKCEVDQMSGYQGNR